MKKQVVLAQVNYQYGKNVFIPYSAGSLQAYAETLQEIKANFHFQPPLFLREHPAKVVNEMLPPAVVGFSCYLWNWEYNKALARAVKARFPEALVVFGGTHVPDASKGFFSEHPYVDILVHHEGEFAFADILLETLNPKPDYSRIRGLSIRLDNNQGLETPANDRIRDLSRLPSPYLSGVFDFLLNRGFALNATQETNRGCPYGCTFCDWGGNTYNKVFLVDSERIIEELRWFGKHQVEYLFSADANWGIMPRDMELTEKMVAIRKEFGGYPRKFRMCTAKKSNDRIFDITKILSDAGMSKGATLSFQSMDKSTLVIVKRENIKIETFSELMGRYRQAGMATYTELIIGMPGETYESSKQGIDTLLEGQDDAVNINAYPCTMLPNSEMNDPAYIKLHGIRSARMPILLAHSTPEPESLTEYHQVVVGTRTMSTEDWIRTYTFYWAVQAFHCLGLLQQVAIFFHKRDAVRYSFFYEELVNHFGANSETLIGRQVKLVGSILRRAMEGGRLDVVLPRFGEICWPLEEASVLALVLEKSHFYAEVREFLMAFSEKADRPLEVEVLDDLLSYQSALVKDPYSLAVNVALRYDLHSYVTNLKSQAGLTNVRCTVRIRPEAHFSGDLERYAREVVWYGRKGGSCHHRDVTVEIGEAARCA